MFWRVSNTVVRTMRSNLPAEVWLDFFSDPVRLEEATPGVVSVSPHDERSNDDGEGRRTYSIKAKTFALCGLTVTLTSQLGGPLKEGEQDLLEEALVVPRPRAVVAMRRETWSPHFTHSLAIYTVEEIEGGGSVVSEMIAFKCPIWTYFAIKAESDTRHEKLLRIFEDDIRGRVSGTKEKLVYA